jgi:hypothetical protein
MRRTGIVTFRGSWEGGASRGRDRDHARDRRVGMDSGWRGRGHGAGRIGVGPWASPRPSPLAPSQAAAPPQAPWAAAPGEASPGPPADPVPDCPTGQSPGGVGARSVRSTAPDAARDQFSRTLARRRYRPGRRVPAVASPTASPTVPPRGNAIPGKPIPRHPSLRDPGTGSAPATLNRSSVWTS